MEKETLAGYIRKRFVQDHTTISDRLAPQYFHDGHPRPWNIAGFMAERKETQ